MENWGCYACLTCGKGIMTMGGRSLNERGTNKERRGIDPRLKVAIYKEWEGIKKRLTSSLFVVPGTGLEPTLLSEHAPETCASTNSATRASLWSQLKRRIVLVILCAQDKTWTCTALRRLPPQSSVSTNSTTWAKTFFSFRKRVQRY